MSTELLPITNSPAGMRTQELDGFSPATDVTAANSSIVTNTAAFIVWNIRIKKQLAERFL